MSRGVLAKQMNDWQILPRPQHLSELYFTHPGQLPASSNSAERQQVAFSVHNLEHQSTTYHYKLIAVSSNQHTKRQIGNGTFMLKHGQSYATNQTIIPPPIGARIEIRVDLEYEGLGLNDSKLSPQTQSIGYWVNIISSGQEGT